MTLQYNRTKKLLVKVTLSKRSNENVRQHSRILRKEKSEVVNSLYNKPNPKSFEENESGYQNIESDLKSNRKRKMTLVFLISSTALVTFRKVSISVLENKKMFKQTLNKQN